jgi:hypothetical protein
MHPAFVPADSVTQEFAPSRAYRNNRRQMSIRVLPKTQFLHAVYSAPTPSPILRHVHGCNSETSAGRTKKLQTKLRETLIERA